MPRQLTRRRVLSAVAAAAGTAAVGSRAVDAEPGGTTRSGSGVAATVREAATAALDEHDADGATVAVVADGETVLTDGFGHAYLNPDAPVDADSTLFRIGSVSKVLPYVAAMRLIDAGEVAPADPVADHLDSVELPDRDAYDAPVRLEHLAAHTSGFDQRSSGQVAAQPDAVRSLPEALAANDPARIHPPGETSLYTNYNAGLAGRLVGDVLDTSFATAIRRSVFEPLGMTESTFAPLPPALVGGREDAAAEVDWFSAMPPASGMSSTATGMAALLHALLGNGPDSFLSDEAVTALHGQWHTPHDDLAGAAFGLERQRRGGRLVVGHEGGVPSFSTDFRYLPEAGVGLFVSVHGSGAYDARSAITEAFLDHVAPVSPPSPSEGPPSRAGDLTGRYRSLHVTDTASFEKALYGITRPTTVVRVEDGTLVTERGGTTHRWVEESPTMFRRADGADRLAFTGLDDGPVRLHRASRPRSPAESIPTHAQGRVHGPLALVGGLAVLSGVVGWPAAVAWRRYRDRQSPPATLSRGRWLAGIAATALFVFAAVALYGVTDRWLYDRPPGFESLFVLPVATTVLAAASAGLVSRAWRRREWGRGSRVHLTLVVAGVATLCGLCWHWNLMWPVA